MKNGSIDQTFKNCLCVCVCGGGGGEGGGGLSSESVATVYVCV